MQTARTVPNNKPDILMRDSKQGRCMLMYVAIPVDRNVVKTEAESVLRYEDRTVEIQRGGNVKAKVIPVVVGTTGTI